MSLVESQGHSLGAHIAGSAGRNLYYKTDKLLPRITGAIKFILHEFYCNFL